MWMQDPRWGSAKVRSSLRRCLQRGKGSFFSSSFTPGFRSGAVWLLSGSSLLSVCAPSLQGMAFAAAEPWRFFSPGFQEVSFHP